MFRSWHTLLQSILQRLDWVLFNQKNWYATGFQRHNFVFVFLCRPFDICNNNNTKEYWKIKSNSATSRCCSTTKRGTRDECQSCQLQLLTLERICINMHSLKHHLIQCPTQSIASVNLVTIILSWQLDAGRPSLRGMLLNPNATRMRNSWPKIRILPREQKSCELAITIWAVEPWRIESILKRSKGPPARSWVPEVASLCWATN